MDRNYFDAGGSSLQAAMLTTQLSQDLGVYVPTALLFDLVDIAHMALAWPSCMRRVVGAVWRRLLDEADLAHECVGCEWHAEDGN
ncbi:MAG: acyl carrier protein [Pirellulaceae bacterium]